MEEERLKAKLAELRAEDELKAKDFKVKIDETEKNLR